MDMRDWAGVCGLFIGMELLRVAGVTMCPWNISVCYFLQRNTEFFVR